MVWKCLSSNSEVCRRTKETGAWVKEMKFFIDKQTLEIEKEPRAHPRANQVARLEPHLRCFSQSGGSEVRAEHGYSKHAVKEACVQA